jgi:chromosomal replication initiator protein
MRLDERFRFDNYVVGSANRLAVGAARAVAESPGTSYNPLFIYSSSGLGKTHLVGAIAQHALALRPELRVEYATLDDFVDELHLAIAAGQTDAFKDRYARVDMLLLDDVQFLTGRRETQTELLKLFNTLQGGGHQIVMTSDRPPSEIADVDHRLISRLSGGLTVDIGAPDYETRVAILRNTSEARALVFGTGVLEELARVDLANVRELQGALNRLAAFQGLGDVPLRVSDVRTVLGDLADSRRMEAPVRPADPVPVASAPASNADVEREFAGFLSDVATVLEQHMEGWRVRLGEAAARWAEDGFAPAVLERAMRLPKEPDVDGLLTTFAAAADRLRLLEQQAAAVDPALRGSPAFRDPERIAEATALVERALATAEPPPAPDARYTRASLAIGAANEMAVRAADAAVGAPGAHYNPLVVHGPERAGKTHLLHAIGHELQRRGVSQVACVGAQAFSDELIAALQSGTVERWRARYRAAGALLVDDVHLIAGMERTQDELFHLFNAMQAAGRQIVLSSRRAPRELRDLDERLRSRFGGGLVVPMDRVEPPEPDAERMDDSHAYAGAAARADIDAYFLDAEKVVFEWPDVGGRLIEELR